MPRNIPSSQTDQGKQGQGKHSKAHYTAVIYVHGMGSQRRNEEVSTLVDHLDKYAFKQDDFEKVGKLMHIKAHLEINSVEPEKNISAIRLKHVIRKNDKPQEQEFRFYEVYWAPIMAGGSSVVSVMKWLFSQAFTPLKTLRTPWRLRARLRRTALCSLWHKMNDADKHNNGYGNKHFEELLKRYDDFEGPEARRRFKKGTFRDFVNYIQKRGDKGNHLTKLAKQWRLNYFVGEVFNEVVLLTLLVAMLLGAGAVFWLALMILNTLSVIDTSGIPFDFALESSTQNILTVAGILLGIFGITRFIKDYLGDVQMWATYTETDEKYLRRAKVLEKARSIFHHILHDEKCDRVVVVAHSLGTSVAHDALLDIGRFNRARNIGGAPIKSPLPLYKIEHFISIATPIDKIYYFFESYKSKSHRYNRIIEQLRGDISEVPFAKNKKRQIHWINFWDGADIISGSIESPHNAEYSDLRVDNCEVYNRWFPDPAKSHFAYFEDSRVVRILFNSIFNRKHSFIDTPRNNGIPDYDRQIVGPGKGLVINRIFQGFMLLIPWVIGTTVTVHILQINTQLELVLIILSIAILLVLSIGWSVSSLRGHLSPY